MKISFRCKQSGNIVSFSNEQDIEWMRKEVGYEEIKNGKIESTTKNCSTKESRESIIGNTDESNNEKDVSTAKDGDVGQKDAKMLKKRGRPRNIEQIVI